MEKELLDHKIEMLIIVIILNILVLNLYVLDMIPKRDSNRKRNRDSILTTMETMSHQEFKMHTGLSKKLFNYLLSLIQPELQKNSMMGDISSGNHIHAATKLFVRV